MEAPAHNAAKVRGRAAAGAGARRTNQSVSSPVPPTILNAARGRRDRESEITELRAGLREPLPSLPCKYFYDDVGSQLFESITQLPEYYQTRTEERLLGTVAGLVAQKLGPSELVELGSGAGRKTRLLLDAIDARGSLERCVLFDVNRSFLHESAARLADAYPGLSVTGLVGDFLRDLPSLGRGGGRLIAFLAGTIGNLHPSVQPRFLRALRRQMTAGDGLFVGLDLVKDRARLEAAYNDAAGVTARFNLNVLAVINRNFAADFDPAGFEHVAFYDTAAEWIEMRVRALRPMSVSVRDAAITLDLAAGDEIRTELSCKFTRRSFEQRLLGTGLAITGWFTDLEQLFALALVEPEEG
ncbi:MAG: L-histidine N(alpha)-methyltransferase [Acidobacteria bacterium]|nr:L-histidine N(alpha)-methyltransferase [Acidobacteriota bacterium]